MLGTLHNIEFPELYKGQLVRRRQITATEPPSPLLEAFNSTNAKPKFTSS